MRHRFARSRPGRRGIVPGGRRRSRLRTSGALGLTSALLVGLAVTLAPSAPEASAQADGSPPSDFVEGGFPCNDFVSYRGLYDGVYEKRTFAWSERLPGTPGGLPTYRFHLNRYTSSGGGDWVFQPGPHLSSTICNNSRPTPAQPTPTPTSTPAPTPTPPPPPPPPPDGLYTVFLSLEEGKSDPVEVARAKQGALAHARTLGITPDYLYGAAITGYAGYLTSAQAQQASADKANVQAVESYVDDLILPRRRPDTPVPATQPQVVPTGVDRVGGSATGSRPPVDTDIAILDTGIDLDHPDLNVVGGVDCTRGDGEGYDDNWGHGTQVAGLAAARDNGGDIVGTAPGARLWSVKIGYSSGGSTQASWLCGMDWVVENAAVIDSANMSTGREDYDVDVENADNCDVADHTNIYTLMSCAVRAAGVPFVVPAGNVHIALSRGRDVVPYGGFSQFITVSGLADYDGAPGGRSAASCRDGEGDADDTFDDHSNFGPEVDLIAPSVCVLTTQVGGGTTTVSGTSLAAPLVAGAVAVYRAQHPGASPDQVVEYLRATGSVDWDAADDPDGIKEPLLRVPGPDAPAPTGPAAPVLPPTLSDRYASLLPAEPRAPVPVIG